MPDWRGNPPFGWFVSGVVFLALAVGGTLTGVALAGGGRVYRAEESKQFWWLIALYYLGGVGFIGHFLYQLYFSH